MIRIFLLCLLIPGAAIAQDECSALVDPWLGEELRRGTLNRHARPDDQKPLATLKFDSVPLPERVLRSARLSNGRVVGLLGSDRKKIHFFDLKEGKVRASFSESSAVVDLKGMGHSIVTFIPGERKLNLRSLASLEQPKAWVADPGINLVAMGIGGRKSLRQVVVIDQSDQAWWLDPITFKTKVGPIRLREPDGDRLRLNRRSPLDPLVPLTVTGEGALIIDGRIITVNSRGINKTEQLPVQAQYDWNHPAQSPEFRRQHLANGSLISIDGRFLASAARHSSSRIVIHDARSGAAWLELNDVPSLRPEDITPGTTPETLLTNAEKVFFDPDAGKLAVLDSTRTRIHLTDIRLGSYKAQIPSILSRLLQPAAGRIRITPKFDHPELITGFSLVDSDELFTIDPRTGTITATSFKLSRGRTQHEVEIASLLKNGRKLSTRFTIAKSAESTR